MNYLKELKLSDYNNHSFYIHRELIHNIKFLENDEEIFPDSYVLPFFIHKDEFVDILETEFEVLTWQGNNILAIIETPICLMTMIISSNDNNIYKPVHVSVTFSEFPFIEINKLCKKYNWFLYDQNSNSYLYKPT